MTVDTKTRRRLRQIAHHLHPVVTIADQGVTDGVISETDRALKDHELIKVRVHGEDRALRTDLIDQLAGAVAAEVIQRIGKIAVVYRANPKANPKLSNLKRYAS